MLQNQTKVLFTPIGALVYPFCLWNIFWHCRL